MSFLTLLFDLTSDALIFYTCKDRQIWEFIGARLVLSTFKLFRRLTRKSKPKTLPHLYDFTPEEQRAILEAGLAHLPSWINFPDFERAEWVNAAIARMWIPCGDLIVELFKTRAEPFVNNAIENSVTFRFETVNVGSIPVKIAGVKVYRENIDRTEIMVDLELFYNGNADFTVSLAGIRAGVKNVRFQGTVRIIFKPILGDLPLIGQVRSNCIV